MRKLDNKGMTLVETLLSFVLLGVLVVVATQLIHSSTEVYYFTRSESYGIQAAQIVATELRGEIEDAMPLFITASGSDKYYIDLSDPKEIKFVSDSGRFKYIYLKTESGKKILKEETYNRKNPSELQATKDYDSKYIGMGYEVKEISFYRLKEFDDATSDEKLPISDCPVLVMNITVGNDQYDTYTCKEYIPLYGLYGLEESLGLGNGGIWNMIKGWTYEPES